jgi:hypothetical protein
MGGDASPTAVIRSTTLLQMTARKMRSMKSQMNGSVIRSARPVN